MHSISGLVAARTILQLVFEGVTGMPSSAGAQRWGGKPDDTPYRISARWTQAHISNAGFRAMTVTAALPVRTQAHWSMTRTGIPDHSASLIPAPCAAAAPQSVESCNSESPQYGPGGLASSMMLWNKSSGEPRQSTDVTASVWVPLCCYGRVSEGKWYC